jgi:hypothetical protein
VIGGIRHPCVHLRRDENGRSTSNPVVYSKTYSRYVAFTARGHCILGVALTEAADEEHLREAYGQLAEECRDIKPDYAPETVILIRPVSARATWWTV